MKKEPTYNELKSKSATLEAELKQARADRFAAEQRTSAALDALEEQVEKRRPVYTIEYLTRGRRITGVVRTAHGIDGYTVLGLLTQAIEEVRQQLTRSVEVTRIVKEAQDA